ILERLAPVFETEQPDMILVHGDTTTTFAASLAAFYHHIPIGHVEAGLRTWKKYSPYPEEMNRQLTDVLADLYFAPTDLAKENLLKEGRHSDLIFITGNTAIDALRYTVNQEFNHPILEMVDPQKKLIVVTMHRRENQGEPMRQVFHTLKDLALKHQEIEIVYPVHLSPQVQELAKEVLGNSDRIHLIPPLEVTEFHNLLAKAYLVLTDSGGIQEEAPSLGKPVLVLRDTTERPEGVEAGTLKLVGTETAT
ncbi:UDP-N-acetylglucosamine 2-epimerase (non-hydrolyzing), partial [Enterococcus faecalis]|nr:UDP-N-acetylglucosamine 2-epimerase (non-hydrolyzing) [Enterococcus faecalis]